MKIASNKIKDIVRFFQEELKDLYERSELETLIAYCFEYYLQISRTGLNTAGESTVSESELLKFSAAVKELKKRKPIQYILGEADFYRMKLKVNEYVLIPRPETEELVYLIINGNKIAAPRILDIGTGSGCIAIALKKNIPLADVSALDVSQEALDVAKQNAKQNSTEINFLLSDILRLSSSISQLPPDSYRDPNSLPIAIGIPTHLDIIVSNPPYICISESAGMDKNVLEYEPHLALFVEDNDPLLFYKAIADLALKNLKPGGQIFFEINQSLSSETKDLLENKGFKNVELIKDLSNNYRILRGNS